MSDAIKGFWQGATFTRASGWDVAAKAALPPRSKALYDPRMLKPGIIGGIGPESTIFYYRQIIAGYRKRAPDGGWPTIILNSIDLKYELELVERDHAGLTKYLAEEIERLERAGADFGLIASNTPHLVFDAVRKLVDLPLLSIVEATRDHAKQHGARTLALLGTRFTMESRFFADKFSAAGMRVVVPDRDQRNWIHDRYIHELIENVLLPETRSGLLAIIHRMIGRDNIDAVLLAGTELPLILTDNGGTGVPFFDTAEIHAAAAVERMLA